MEMKNSCEKCNDYKIFLKNHTKYNFTFICNGFMMGIRKMRSDIKVHVVPRSGSAAEPAELLQAREGKPKLYAIAYKSMR
jgi:hypothetical protein